MLPPPPLPSIVALTPSVPLPSSCRGPSVDASLLVLRAEHQARDFSADNFFSKHYLSTYYSYQMVYGTQDLQELVPQSFVLETGTCIPRYHGVPRGFIKRRDGIKNGAGIKSEGELGVHVDKGGEGEEEAGIAGEGEAGMAGEEEADGRRGGGGVQVEGGRVLIVGDILDQDEEEIAILSLLRSLDKQAKAKGGAVFQVLLKGPKNFRRAVKHLGPAPGVPYSYIKPYVRSKGSKFEKVRGRKNSKRLGV
ncbi:hypothetical protein Ahy_B04g073139 [Arachis hypogaea]|uniref:Large ribosomal subunit protein uL15/eL18 domain-containing protein n=1 Tax=Arachis hypogaea TaxID=3818 RepID=A0A444ZPQ4_ARAHY|nr:hypothetical protein Ahy_B04g073139 [Arachis hypogaea]